jgi:thiamine pyrophosphate-dependent acetolactate synthase large subunit-like protein
MQGLVARYLTRKMSRREIVSSMAKLGFSIAAVESIVGSLEPFVEASPVLQDSAGVPRTVEGTGGELLVEQLRSAGEKYIFNCNSSGTYAIFDALMDRTDMHIIQAPQEGQTVSLAHGYALATGQVPFTIGDSVGFQNTLNNMYNAWKDRTPLIVGTERRATRSLGGMDSFEEWDNFLGPSESFTLWRWSIAESDRIPEIIRRAIKFATTPPGGPVSLAFPQDLLSQKAKAVIMDQTKFRVRADVRPSASLVDEAARMLIEAKSPLLYVGSEVTRSQAIDEVQALAEQLAIPVFQADDLHSDFATNHPLFLGQYAPASRYPAQVDLFINIGAKMPDVPPQGVKVIHVTIDPHALGRTVATDFAILAGVKETAQDLIQAVRSRLTNDRIQQLRSGRFEQTRAFTEKVRQAQATALNNRLNSPVLSWETVWAELNKVIEHDAVIVPELGSANITSFNQFVFAKGYKSRIGRTTGSALGWGVGAALGVKLGTPDRQVIALQGDGGILFGQLETLWSAARYEIPILIVIFNNRSYNETRNRIMGSGGKQGQRRQDMTSYLGDPDVSFADAARAFKIDGDKVEQPAQLAPALQRAVRSLRDGKACLLDITVGRTGWAAESTWYPKFSLASSRNKKI